MSGGHFDYNQCRIGDIRNAIEVLVEENETPDNFGYCANYPEPIIAEFKQAVKALKRAEIFTNRIDWLVSGDDSEDSFTQRLHRELAEV